MMIGKWLGEVFGVNALVQELAEERKAQREMVTQMLITSEKQAEAIKSITSIMESIYKSYQTDGTPPEGRHLSEDQEDLIIRDSFYGPNESDDDGA